MVDFQKAFDNTIDHGILCKKLNGMVAVSIDWFKSFLADRQQVVTINGVTSSPGYVKYGVPHGNIHGPLLFFFYVNDMYTSLSADCKLIL